MNRTTKPRRVCKEPEIVYRPIADELVRVADELVWELEFHLKVMERGCRDKRVTPEKRAERERESPKLGGSSTWSAAIPPDCAR